MDLRDALFDAVVKGDEAGVCYILNIGGSLAINDSKGFTALHWAASNKQSERLVPLLISKKANVNAIDNNGQTPLHVHCARACTYGVACLLFHGADPNCRTTDHNISPLDIAEAHRMEEIVKLLLTYGAIPSSATPANSPNTRPPRAAGAALSPAPPRPNFSSPAPTTPSNYTTPVANGSDNVVPPAANGSPKTFDKKG